MVHCVKGRAQKETEADPSDSLEIAEKANLTERFSDTICFPVFVTAALSLLALIVFCSVWPETSRLILTSTHEWLGYNLGSLYLLLSTVTIVTMLALVLGPYGNIKLGEDDATPEFSTLAWLSMLYCGTTSMGTLYFAVAQPVLFYKEPPVSAWSELTRQEMAAPLTVFHTGLHAWIFYSLTGLSVAYFSYRKNLPLLFRSCFYPIFGRNIYSWPGHIVDIIAIIACMFGMAATLIIGSLNLSAGLNYMWGVPHTTATQIIIMACITAAAITSLITGIHRGIKYLSYASAGLATLMLLFVYCTGPVRMINDGIVDGLGRYINMLLERSLVLSPYDEREKGWIVKWTLFFLGWNLVLSPTVGIFYARISKGRTIREVVLGTTLVPTTVSLVWYTSFWVSSFYVNKHVANNFIDEAYANQDMSMYIFFKLLPWTKFASSVCIFLMILYFVTSSDSASFVVDLLAAGGHPHPPVWQRVFWGTMEGATTAVLLYSAGSKAMQTLQSGVGCIGVPVALLLITVLFGFVKTVMNDQYVAPTSSIPADCKEGYSCVETAQTYCNQEGNSFVETVGTPWEQHTSPRTGKSFDENNRNFSKFSIDHA